MKSILLAKILSVRIEVAKEYVKKHPQDRYFEAALDTLIEVEKDCIKCGVI